MFFVAGYWKTETGRCKEGERAAEARGNRSKTVTVQQVVGGNWAPGKVG